jgi:two-component system response regulator HydG
VGVKGCVLLALGTEAERRPLRDALEKHGLRVVEAESVDGSLRRLVSAPVAALVSTPRVGGEDGAHLYALCSRLNPPVEAFALLGAGEGAPLAAFAVSRDAGPDAVAERIVSRLRPGTAARPLHAPGSPFGAALDLASRYAASDASVLITGETGTGKELAARFIHERSPRARGPFVPVNSAAIPEPLLEAELFGHERGAFTGAERARAGRFALAAGGTIFLDEIGEMPPALQAKLLRVLQDGIFEPLGATRSVRADFRVVAATHRDLAAMVERGAFREDLYYRLNVLPLALPPLRERPADVAVLAEHFLRRAADRHGAGRVELAGDALAALSARPWPGNARELENLMERLALTATGMIHAESVPGAPAPAGPAPFPPRGVDLPGALRDLERGLIREALARTAGNKGRAARLLGLNRTTLVEKLKRLPDAPAPAAPRGRASAF